MEAKEFYAATKTDELKDQIRFAIQPREDYDIDLWIKRIAKDAEKRQSIKAESEASNASKPSVKCPYCNSLNTKKISGFAKGANTALFGFFGTKRHKQWHCKSCDSDF